LQRPPKEKIPKCVISLLSPLLAEKMSPAISLLTSFDDDSDDTNDCPLFVVGCTLGVGGKFQWKWHDDNKENMKI
jgi:hypothetical protein